MCICVFLRIENFTLKNVEAEFTSSWGRQMPSIFQVFAMTLGNLSVGYRETLKKRRGVVLTLGGCTAVTNGLCEGTTNICPTCFKKVTASVLSN